MRVDYSVTGSRRKSLASAVSQCLNSPVEYLGAPTFAYKIGGYTIDKNGVLEGKDKRELVTKLNEQHGFKAIKEEHGRPLMQNKTDSPNCPDGLVVEMPLAGFTPEKLDNLTKLVSAKEPLLKAALGAKDLPIQQTGDTLKFPWFKDGLDADTVNAYITLTSLICKAAKEKKRVMAKAKAVEGSPRYAMRCFLLSLGFIGDEYKTARKILLSKLDGSSSRKNGGDEHGIT